MKYSSFEHAFTFYAVYLYFLRSANIIKTIQSLKENQTIIMKFVFDDNVLATQTQIQVHRTVKETMFDARYEIIVA